MVQNWRRGRVIYIVGTMPGWLQHAKSSKNPSVTTRLALGAGFRHVGYTLLHLSRKKCNRQNIDKQGLYIYITTLTTLIYYIYTLCEKIGVFLDPSIYVYICVYVSKRCSKCNFSSSSSDFSRFWRLHFFDFQCSIGVVKCNRFLTL